MSNVSLTFDGDRAYVALDRPDKHNGLTIDMLGELARVARAVGKRDDIRAVILSGNGPSFSSGLDIAKTAGDPLTIARSFVPLPWRGTNTFQEACWAWRRLPQPVIAAVHGHCYGGGLQIALAADFRFATPDADFSVMEVRHGLIPDMTGAATLSRLIGIDKALLLTMTADPVDAAYAERIGLVTEVAADPRGAAEKLADRIAARPPHAVAAAKRLFDRSWQAATWRTLGIERATQLPLVLRQALGRR
ncbi:crotonase/enoyl-CoA hydratase family protein [Nocardia terpenica]|uniref:Enoyl-CoA hydratase n=1 Tax=Nocardia terpenica TaxID=455432 RepID=A0A164IR74_9NOCA|nr:crotonase/enoyl-CoA hydratase family protein [Nocardia terpenica]KZM69680.1 enoyl-CoA hydratase [Nocardia terpenica]MBF6062847.1 crotonase/enoyl-CoA hydratase family protein [Nocardia terpenica]MBF6105018.1 crotonase/enoyl-CoA hydratase family protein [Nocardia terpenica]MBF6112545.1 crotonase/enoyl-CoA hydratase family protein [Nocardia terpenica]MBF6118746.1 crotonase/enoyl-CoA hydratase family protein [Nocardia terpenica]